MKAIRTIMFVALAAFCVSCGSSRKSQQSQQPQQPYPDYAYPPQYYQPQAQQGTSDGFIKKEVSRIMKLSVEQGTNEIRAYGQAVDPNEQMAISLARSQASAALQAKVEVYVRAAWDQYHETTAVNGQYGADDNARAQVITAVKSALKGVDDVDFDIFYNPTERLYKCEYCVKYNRAGIMAVMAQQSARIKANEKQFEKDVQHAWDYLDAQNYTETLGEQQAARQNAMYQDNLDREHQREMQRNAQYNQQPSNQQPSNQQPYNQQYNQ